MVINRTAPLRRGFYIAKKHLLSAGAFLPKN
nr:MAG TPA: hypothetical protein [Caudoviricetes sp.]